MPGNPRDMITMAEQHFPVRIRLGIPPGSKGLAASLRAARARPRPTKQ
jgi:hypothetical protein